MKKDTVRVLMVDDDLEYICISKTKLESQGYAVSAVSDGLKAVELASVTELDLIILDIRMPGLDGYEVCRRIREFSMVPIIMLSALAEPADKAKGLLIGADDYVSKPFRANELVARVRAVLRRVEFSKQGPRPLIPHPSSIVHTMRQANSAVLAST